MDDYFNGKQMLLKYDQLFMFGTRGDINLSLSGARDVIKTIMSSAEVSPVKYEDLLLRGVLDIFIANPSMDIVISSRGGDSAITGSSLRRQSLISNIEAIARVINFVPKDIEVKERNEWEKNFEFEKTGYLLSREAAIISRTPLESFFGATRYAHFLSAYNGVERKKAEDMAKKRFSLPDPVILS